MKCIIRPKFRVFGLTTPAFLLGSTDLSWYVPENVSQHWQDAFLSVPQLVWEARKALLRVVTVGEMNAVRQEHDREVLSLALKLIHESNQKFLKRLLKISKQEQP